MLSFEIAGVGLRKLAKPTPKIVENRRFLMAIRGKTVSF
jgi:hypothetical protein